jgi:glutaredoxin
MTVELYYFNTCPFCVMVLSQIKKLGLEEKIILKDIHQDSNAREHHYNKTGRTTVPCLYIDDEPLFESGDIINWLQENKDKV